MAGLAAAAEKEEECGKSIWVNLDPENLGDEGAAGAAGATGAVLVSERMKQAALRALCATTPGWEDGDGRRDTGRGIQLNGAGNLESIFTIQAIPTGMTNHVFRCSKPNGQNRTVLLRIYGRGTEMFFSRESEIKTLRLLAGRGLAPALLATFGNGRVEEFLKGKVLNVEDMRKPEISALVARRLAELHAFEVDAVDRCPLIFRKLKDFHQKAMDIYGPSYNGIDVAELGKIITRLRDRLDHAAASEVVFCHNDLQYANVMYDDTISDTAASSSPSSAQPSPATTRDTSSQADGTLTSSSPLIPPADTPAVPTLPVGQLSFIDYEYSGYNPRGFDVGNHFCEWMSDYDKSRPHLMHVDKYPSLLEKRRFCRAYLMAQRGLSNVDVSWKEIERLVVEADRYSLASHIFWALWALLQAKDPAASGFDYLAYAAERVRVYRYFEERTS